MPDCNSTPLPRDIGIAINCPYVGVLASIDGEAQRRGRLGRSLPDLLEAARRVVRICPTANLDDSPAALRSHTPVLAEHPTAGHGPDQAHSAAGGIAGVRYPRGAGPADLAEAQRAPVHPALTYFRRNGSPGTMEITEVWRSI